MFNMLTKKNQLPASRSPFAPSNSSTLWGGFEEMDRMFDRLFHGFDQTINANGWKAPLAVWEDKDHFYVEVELAGVPQDEVDVTIQQRQLLISYARKIPENRQFIYNERPYGCFDRRLALPESVKVDTIKAEMRDGLLQITLDKAPEAQRRKIAVQAG
jgi:HSP20 family protein